MSFFTHPWIQWDQPDIKLLTHPHPHPHQDAHMQAYTHTFIQMNGQYWLSEVKALFLLPDYSRFYLPLCCLSFSGSLWALCRLGSVFQGMRVCVCVCMCARDREKAESNKLAEMVPSELHDWSIEFHHGDWPVGLNGSRWVTRLKHHTGFISPPDWSVTRDLDHTLTLLPASVYECVCDYRRELRLWSSNVFVREWVKEVLCTEKV